MIPAIFLFTKEGQNVKILEKADVIYDNTKLLNLRWFYRVNNNGVLMLLLHYESNRIVRIAKAENTDE